MKLKIDCKTIAALLIASASVYSLAGNAWAGKSSWSVKKSAGKIRATDCRNCGEDANIVLSCSAGGKLAQVIVNGVATPKGKPRQIAPVKFNIEGRRYTYSAKTLHVDGKGNIPVFVLPTNDPMVDELQAAKHASVTFHGQDIDIDLTGSASALKKFRQYCGWNKPILKNNPEFTASIGEDANTHVPDFSQTVRIVTPALPDNEGRFWHTGDGFGGGSPRRLSYSLTDSIGELVSADCQTFGKPDITLKTAFGLENHEDGDGVILEILHDAGVSAFAGKINIKEGVEAAASFDISAADAMWQSLAFSPAIIMRLRGGQPVSINGMTGNSAIQEFTRACSSRVEPVESTQNNFISPNFTIGLK